MSHRSFCSWLPAVVLTALAAAAPAVVAQDAEPLDLGEVALKAVHGADAVAYAPGDEMELSFQIDFKGQDPAGRGYSLAWVRNGDDGQKEEGSFPINAADETYTVKTKIDKPGFVRIRAHLVDAAGKAHKRRGNAPLDFDGGMGAGIDQIDTIPEPADFDEFWAKQKARLAAVPLRADLTLINTVGGHHIYAVKIDCAGDRPATGYMTVPVDAAEKPVPACFVFQGYGVNPQRAPGGGYGGRIIFRLNAHGLELDQPAEYYKEFWQNIKSNGYDYAFDPAQNKDPETAYYNGMALRVLRALEYVKSLPEWDGKNLIVQEGSQGGLQCLWAAGLDPAVTEVDTWFPWGADFAGHKVLGRMAGFNPEWVDALGYYDTVHHAKRVKCPVRIQTAGLGDYTCPPSGVAAMYNALSTPKSIKWIQGMDHNNRPPDAAIYPRESK